MAKAQKKTTAEGGCEVAKNQLSLTSPSSRIRLMSAPEDMLSWQAVVRAVEAQRPSRRTKAGSMTVALAMAKLYKMASKGREMSRSTEEEEGAPSTEDVDDPQNGSQGSTTHSSSGSDDGEEDSQETSVKPKSKDQSFAVGCAPTRKPRRRRARTKSEEWAELYIKTWASPPPEPVLQPFQISQFQGRIEDEFLGMANDESRITLHVRRDGREESSLAVPESQQRVLRESRDKVEAWFRKYFVCADGF